MLSTGSIDRYGFKGCLARRCDHYVGQGLACPDMTYGFNTDKGHKGWNASVEVLQEVIHTRQRKTD